MPTFLLGAGFNADAKAECDGVTESNGYPLVAETAKLCFGLSEIPPSRSIEDLFAESMRDQNFEPLKRLARRLCEADYYIAQGLAQDQQESCYRGFFQSFSNSTFLTFNYDSLPETILFHLNSWYPNDGYGLSVETSRHPGVVNFHEENSTAIMLHLHGSLCISTSEFEILRKPEEEIGWITQRKAARYSFDPKSISHNFSPYRSQVGTVDIEEQIIAPVPDKASELTKPFIAAVYRKAIDAIRTTDTLVSIGYSFGRHDFPSYKPLLDALDRSANQRLIVVCPEADTVAQRIRELAKNFAIEPVPATFSQWVRSSYRGL